MSDTSVDEVGAKFSAPISRLGMEDKLIALAYKRAQEQLRKGTVSSQTLNHFLELGTARQRVLLEKAQLENEYLRAKIEAADAASRLEDMYDGVLEALRGYKGSD